MGTGFTGPSSLGRGQRPCFAAGVCRDNGTDIGFGTGCASALSPKPGVQVTKSCGLNRSNMGSLRSWW